MNQAAIILPMIALAGWTFAVVGLIPFQRFRAAFRRQVTADDFKFGESAKVPPGVSIPNRNYMNLLEMPMLFYVVCLGFYTTGTVNSLAIKLAWGFVALRVCHSLVHLTYNKVFHRLTFFAAANFVLMGMWIVFLVRIWPAQ